MLEKFIDSQIVLSMGFSSKVITYVLVNIMIGKKKGRRIFLLCCIIHYLTYNVGLLVIFDFFFGSELWFRLLMPTVSLVLGIGVPVIMSIVWKINFSKMMLGFLIPDSLSLLVYIPAQLTGNPVMVILFSITALIFICIFFSRFFEKYQTLQIRHTWLISGLTLITLANGWITNILYALEEEGIVPASIYSMGLFQVFLILFFIFAESILYVLVAKQKQRMLLRNKDQMESYYRQVARHIREIDETRILLEQGTKLLSGADAASGAPKPFGVSKASGAGVPGRQMEREEQEAVAAAPDGRAAMNPRQLQAYLAKLKSQYEALGEVFFCNDFAVDSVLRDYVVRCRKEGIKTDILFHEYQRGKVAAEDAAAILSRMLDYGIKAAKLPEDWKIQTAEWHTVFQDKMAQTVISLHGASVKNQLLFSMTVTREGDRDADKNLLKIRIRKHSFNPWMRKYNGIVHVQREETRLQMVVGLENGKKQ